MNYLVVPVYMSTAVGRNIWASDGTSLASNCCEISQ